MYLKLIIFPFQSPQICISWSTIKLNHLSLSCRPCFHGKSSKNSWLHKIFNLKNSHKIWTIKERRIRKEPSIPILSWNCQRHAAKKVYEPKVSFVCLRILRRRRVVYWISNHWKRKEKDTEDVCNKFSTDFHLTSVQKVQCPFPITN